MFRASALHRIAASLALLAIGLLVAVPTLGRLAQQGQGGIATPAHAVCDMAVGADPLAPSHTMGSARAGGSHGGHHGGPPVPRAPAPVPRAPHHPDADCDYCPLLAAALVVLALVLAPGPLAFGRVFGGARPSSRRLRRDPYPCGLGSRGPPLAA